MYNLFSMFYEKSWQFKLIERFIIVFYDRVNIHQNVNDARQEMLCKKSWNLENVSLTQYALHLHVVKASLLIRQKHNMAKVKTILLIISMRHLQIFEHQFLHRHLSFIPSQELKTPLHFIEKPGYLHGKRQNLFL